jgi:hypothetical protein
MAIRSAGAGAARLRSSYQREDSTVKSVIACTLLLASAIAPAAEVADYRFDGTFESAIPGAPALQELEPFGGAFVMDDRIGRIAWQFPAGSGLVMNVSGLVPETQYSLVIQVRSGLDTAYMKLVDASDRQADHGLYFSYDDLGFYPRAFGDDNMLLTPDAYYTVAVTRAASGEYVGYIDGVERFRFQDVAGESRVPPSGLLHLFRDDAATGDNENSQGAVARIRVFDTALPSFEIVALSNSLGGFRNGFED